MLNRVSLSGPWQATWTSGQHGNPGQYLEPVCDPARYITLDFPGSIQTGLERAGLLDDPRAGVNSLKARWVEEQYWVLRREFEVPTRAIDQPAYLHVDVLDGVAMVALNGIVVGSHANANRPAEIDLTGKLRPGTNEITIQLESGLFKVADLPGSDYNQVPETLLNKRHHLRQAQYQFGWDWNPRLIYLGLHGALEVVWGAGPWLKQVSVLGEVAPDLSSARIRVRPLFYLPGEQAAKATLHLTSLGGLSAQAETELVPDETEAEVVLEIANPHLWWPRGHGEPFLYPLTLTVEVDGSELARWEGRTGLRRVEIDQPPHPESGRYFHLKINNRPIFCKGANWVPPEMSAHEVAPERVAALVDLAVAENMNILRLWGGGVWANHPLLDECDRRGILLWHDLLFACSKYPADQPDFLEEVEREVAWGAREFSRHPALVVWCGNNELEWGLWEWGYKRFGRTAPDMVLFHHIFPALLARLDPTRPYWPSSPYSSPTVTPSVPTEGDQHPWGVSLGKDDSNFWAYRGYVDRFPNEGGVLGCAPVNSLRRFLSASELKMRSFAWEHHDNTIEFAHAEEPMSYRLVEHWLGQPAQGMDLETYALANGLLQAEGLKEYIHNYRRRWPSTGSAIYWMFNDSWPTVHGWATFDYYLNRKLAFHPVRRAFSDQIVVLADEGEVIGVYACNDSAGAVSMTLQWGSFDPTGPLQPASDPLPVTLEPFSSRCVAVLPRDPNLIAYAVLHDENGAPIAQDRLLLRPFQAWQVAQPDIRVEVVDRGGARFARYTSPTWVWAAILDPTGEQPIQDDVFDLLPGLPYEVPLAPGEAPRPVAATGNALLHIAL